MIAAAALSLSDRAVIALLGAAIPLVFLAAGGIGVLLDWLDRRRAPSALTRDQLLDRGAPPWPYELHTWDELYRTDAEGEVVP